MISNNTIVSLGISRNRVPRDEAAPKVDTLVLVVHGILEGTMRAREILNHTTPEILEHHT